MTILQEALLWKTALRYLGPSNLYQTVVDLWCHEGVPARSTVEYLTNDTVGDEVVIILKNAQAQVGAMVPGREVAPDTCALYSRHASELACGLLGRLPVRELPLSLRGFRLESDLGM